jgi:hypothetical protein
MKEGFRSGRRPGQNLRNPQQDLAGRRGCKFGEGGTMPPRLLRPASW